MKLYGVTCVQYLKTHNYGEVYLVGEVHNTTNTANPCNLNEALRAWKPQECWTELTAGESYAAVAAIQKNGGVAFTPLMHLAHISGTKTQSYNVFPVNVRREPPLHILESIFDYGVFMNTHQTNTMSISPDSYIATKMLEKRFFKCMSHRRSAIVFLRALIVPDLSLPAWYQKCLDDFESAGIRVSNKNPIKDTLSGVNPELQAKIIAFAVRHWTDFIDNDTYSQALASASNTRRSDSPNLVMGKYKDLRAYFISLFAILMDVYILARLSTAAPATRVITMGFNHMQRVFQFLVHNTPIDGGWTAYSHTEAFVDLSQKQPLVNIQIARNPKAELQAFRDNKEVKKATRKALGPTILLG